MWCSVASVAVHHHPRVAGEATGVNVEATSEPNCGYIQPLGLREQALEVEGMLCQTGCSLDASSFRILILFILEWPLL